MGSVERILRPVKKVRAGVSLPHNKHTAESQTVMMPSPESVCILMQQHIGAPCVPCVKKGDKVCVGTLIGRAESYVSAPVHSSISGTVSEIKKVRLVSGGECDAVVIESDGLDTVDESVAEREVTNKEQLIDAARDCGLVGLGGAGFPAHVKLNVKAGVEYDTLVVNAAECEPFITSDYRECMECYDDVINGIYLLKDILGFKKVIIGVEDNKPKAIAKLFEVATDKRDTDDTVKLMKLKSSYPQGAEKMLIYTTTGRVLKMGMLPIDIGCVVMNITSIGTLYRYIKTGMPLTKKRLTVDGDAVNNPQNVMVPIGTSIADIIEFCGGFKAKPAKILMGGPMMGICVNDVNYPVTKHNNAVLSFLANEPEATACIKCGRCFNACPMHLVPAAVENALKLNNIDALNKLNVNYCMECGSCAYSCPAKRPLTQVMRISKQKLREAKK